MITDNVRNATGAVLSITQIIASSWSELTGAGQSETKEANKYAGPLTPASQTFTIWLPLFLCGMVYSAYTLLPHNRNNPSLKNVGWWANFSFMQNILWSLNSQFFGLGWQSVGLIGSAAFGAVSTTIKSQKFPDEWITNTFAPLAGWLTLAVPVNIETTLNKTGKKLNKDQATIRSIFILLFALAVIKKVNTHLNRKLLYNLPITIGLTGSAIKNVKKKNFPVVAACIAGIILVSFWTLSKRKGYSS